MKPGAKAPVRVYPCDVWDGGHLTSKKVSGKTPPWDLDPNWSRPSATRTGAGAPGSPPRRCSRWLRDPALHRLTRRPATRSGVVRVISVRELLAAQAAVHEQA